MITSYKFASMVGYTLKFRNFIIHLMVEKSNYLANNAFVAIFFKVILPFTFIGVILYNMGYLFLYLSQFDAGQVREERTRTYMFIILGVGLFIFHLKSKNDLKNKSSRIYRQVKLSYEDKLEKEELEQFGRYSVSKFKFKYVLIRSIIGAMVSIGILIITYTDGIFDYIAILFAFISLVLYYNSFNEDPEELIKSSKYDRQRVDQAGGITAYMEQF